MATKFMTNILTNTGLNLPEKYTEEQFFQIGRSLVHIEHGLQFAQGDWFNNIPWGDKKAACEKVGLNYKTAVSFGKVAAEFQMSTRVDNLTFSAHKALVHNSLTDSQRDQLLHQAKDESWSFKQLTLERDKVLDKEIPATKTVAKSIAESLEQGDNNTAALNTPEINAALAGGSEDSASQDDMLPKNVTGDPVDAEFTEVNDTPDIVELELKIEELEAESLTDQARIDELETENDVLKAQIDQLQDDAKKAKATIKELIVDVEKKSAKKSVKKSTKVVTSISIIEEFMPKGIACTNEIRSALSNTYKTAKNIKGRLSPRYAQGVREYFESLSDKDILHIIEEARITRNADQEARCQAKKANHKLSDGKVAA